MKLVNESLVLAALNLAWQWRGSKCQPRNSTKIVLGYNANLLTVKAIVEKR